MASPKCSVCIATRNKAELLQKVLASITAQTPSFAYEIVIVDDGSTDNTAEVCRLYQTRYVYIANDCYRNPAVARNVAYREARGKVLICQSDDVVHEGLNTIQNLSVIEPETFNIATVWNQRGRKIAGCYTGTKNKRPFFFLGSLLRKHCYLIGGNSEDFTEPGYEDDWFAACLMNGLQLKPVYRQDVVGYHQDHPRPPLQDSCQRMQAVWNRKCKDAEEGRGSWIGGEPWPYIEETA